MRSRRFALLLCLVAIGLAFVVGQPSGVLSTSGLIIMAVISTWIGYSRPWQESVLLALPLVAWEWQEGYLNPLYVVFVVGAVGIGQILQSRQRMQAELALRAVELEAERELYVHEAVRYERGRIARELHDIVAHNVSMVVIQAVAAQRVLQTAPDVADEAMAEIARATAEASAEIDALVVLLETEVSPADRALIEVVDEIIGRARRAGLDVSLRIDQPMPLLTAEIAAVVHRVVQEALTNALKHSPGAPVVLTMSPTAAALQVEIDNAASSAVARDDGELLHRAGGGHGIRGMQERARAVGGDCTAAATDDGGWRVLLRVPVAT